MTTLSMEIDHITKAIEVLKQGGVVIFPTDTAFGIGCRVDDEYAIQKVFSLRRRPETKATPILVSSLTMAKQFATLSDDVTKKLIEPYWPGALTVVVPADTKKIPSLARGGGLTVGLRMPDHEVTLGLIHGVGVPILGPSANFSGGQTPHQLADVDPQLLSMVDYVVPGVCKHNLASTVVDTTIEPWEILRQGAIDIKI
jgi:L-threonylcarbamoyladenylate synthase